MYLQRRATNDRSSGHTQVRWPWPNWDITIGNWVSCSSSQVFRIQKKYAVTILVFGTLSHFIRSQVAGKHIPGIRSGASSPGKRLCIVPFTLHTELYVLYVQIESHGPAPEISDISENVIILWAQCVDYCCPVCSWIICFKYICIMDDLGMEQDQI